MAVHISRYVYTEHMSTALYSVKVWRYVGSRYLHAPHSGERRLPPVQCFVEREHNHEGGGGNEVVVEGGDARHVLAEVLQRSRVLGAVVGIREVDSLDPRPQRGEGADEERGVDTLAQRGAFDAEEVPEALPPDGLPLHLPPVRHGAAAGEVVRLVPEEERKKESTQR